MLTIDDLHDYQRLCVARLVENPLFLLLLSCGLGKTVIVLTALNILMYERFEISRVIVFCPIRVAAVWKSEAESWSHLGGLRVSVAIGTARERTEALKKDADIYVLNYENTPWLVEKSGLPFDYDVCVLDEISRMKNWNAKRVRSFMKVRPFLKRVIGLTATPTSNGLMDLFSIVRCVDMGVRLGRRIGSYRLDFFKPDKMNGPIVYSYKPLPGAEEEIYRRISDIAISMKSTEMLKMPELISTEYKVQLSDDERGVYDEMKKDLMISIPDKEVTSANAAVLVNKLAQISNGAIYSDSGEVIEIHSKKLDALEDIIEGMNGQPLLVAYWFKHDLTRIAKRLDELGVTYERLNSDQSIERWNRQELTVGLAQPQSVGHGVNLQKGGNTICWFGPCWSYDLYTQMTDRIFRQGQEAGTVIVQHIITEDSIDERIMKALSQKEMTQDALIEAVKASL
ncbi:MAG: DEAD/DEAH box helicase [Lachnospiraceae bacterium]|nr:DEAD/DEAH box helicase [Lachnospiraceae bacterium]